MKPFWLLVLVGTLVGCAQVAERVPPASPPPTPAWAMEGGNPGRTSQVALAGPARWESWRSVSLVSEPGYAPEEYATPLLVEDHLYVGTSNRAMVALDLDGEPLWRLPVKGRVYTTAAYDNGLLFFGDDEGELVAMTLAGQEFWRFPVSYPVVSSPLVADGKVYVAVADQNVFCVEAATGRPLWQYGRHFPRRNSLWRALGISYGAGRVYAGFADGTVVALDASVGKVEWRFEVGVGGFLGDVAAGPVFSNGRVYAGSFHGPTVCLDAATGRELWRQEVEAASGFAVGKEALYLGTAAGSLEALSLADGKKLWEVKLDGGVPTVPTLAGDTVIVGASAGSIYGFDATTGEERGRYTPGPGLRAQPLPVPGGVVFLSNRGVLHWLR